MYIVYAHCNKFITDEFLITESFQFILFFILNYSAHLTLSLFLYLKINSTSFILILFNFKNLHSIIFMLFPTLHLIKIK